MPQILCVDTDVVRPTPDRAHAIRNPCPGCSVVTVARMLLIKQVAGAECACSAVHPELAVLERLAPLGSARQSRPVTPLGVHRTEQLCFGKIACTATSLPRVTKAMRDRAENLLSSKLRQRAAGVGSLAWYRQPVRQGQESTIPAL